MLIMICQKWQMQPSISDASQSDTSLHISSEKETCTLENSKFWMMNMANGQGMNLGE